MTNFAIKYFERRDKILKEKALQKQAETKNKKKRKPRKQKSAKTFVKGFDFDKEVLKTKGKPYSSFLMSKYWRKIKEIVLIRDGKKCTVCKSQDCLEVHHTTYKHHYKEHNYLEELVTLCSKCHNEYHSTVYDHLNK